MTSQPKIGGLILAGGQGQRVHGQNKGLLTLREKPLAQHLADRFRKDLAYLAISANRQIEVYRQFNVPVFTDEPAWQGMGPLAGVISSCRHFPDNLDAILVMPCDTPFLPSDLISRLSNALFSETQNQIAYAATRQSIHPSVFLFKPAINQNLAEHIDAGQRSLKSWLFIHKVIEVLFDDEDNFTNINNLNMLNRLNMDKA